MIIKNILKFIGVERRIIKEEAVYLFNFKKTEYLNNYIVKGVLIRLNKLIEREKTAFHKESPTLHPWNSGSILQIICL